jgi:hypothetical protein
MHVGAAAACLSACLLAYIAAPPTVAVSSFAAAPTAAPALFLPFSEFYWCATSSAATYFLSPCHPIACLPAQAAACLRDRLPVLRPLPADLFLSASEDGTVREFDVRQRPAAVHREALAGDDANVLGGWLLGVEC